MAEFSNLMMSCEDKLRTELTELMPISSRRADKPPTG